MMIISGLHSGYDSRDKICVPLQNIMYPHKLLVPTMQHVHIHHKGPHTITENSEHHKSATQLLSIITISMYKRYISVNGTQSYWHPYTIGMAI